MKLTVSITVLTLAITSAKLAVVFSYVTIIFSRLMKDPQYIEQLNTTASLADVIAKVNTVIDTVNFMFIPHGSGSLED